MKNHPNIECSRHSSTTTMQQGGEPSAAVLGRTPDLAASSAPTCSRPQAPQMASSRAGQGGNIKVVAFDAPRSIVDQLKDGTFEIAIAQHPAEIGYFGVIAAYAHLTGNSVPRLIGTGFTVMTKDNIGRSGSEEVHLHRVAAALRRRPHRGSAPRRQGGRTPAE